jgi:hypothetical protein
MISAMGWPGSSWRQADDPSARPLRRFGEHCWFFFFFFLLITVHIRFAYDEFLHWVRIEKLKKWDREF